MAFWVNSDGAKHPGPIISHAKHHRKVFEQKSDWTWRSLETVKIEGYKSQFLTSLGLLHRM